MNQMPRFSPDAIDDEAMLEATLYDLLAGNDDLLLDAVTQIDRFEEAGILTLNRGLVLGLTSGAEFQVTIVQSRTPRERS